MSSDLRESGPHPEQGPGPDGPGVSRRGSIVLGTYRAALTVILPGVLAWLGHSLSGAPFFRSPAPWALGLLCSPIFLVTLGAELLLVALWRSRGFPSSERVLYLGPGAIVLCGIGGTLSGEMNSWALLGASAFLVVWFTYVLQFVYRHKRLGATTMRLVRDLGLLAVVASAGWFIWTLEGQAIVWGLAGIVGSIVLVRALSLPGRHARGEERSSWLERPGWTVELLAMTFVAEFFVGALLDLELAGRGFLQYIPFVPAHGSPGAVALLETYDGLWFGAAILASAWFLVAIGVTMGGLVVLRMREVHIPAQRYRMALMLAVYALAAVYIPSLASSTPLVSNGVLASLPVVGWGFGLRSGGPFESGVFLAVLVMYALVGVLTVLFGRKALCSVLCGAALMYQGSTMHEMREFNRNSRVGRYFLGSRLSTAYVVASVLALSSLFAVSLFAYLHRLPTVQVANGEYDSGALPLPIELYFGGLWFAMFVSTPYVGTYNCATTGVCHWGSLSVPFAKVSLFRLKVKDRSVCQRCTTFDCAKACPVGLVDMPLYFRTTGEFRSTKCCGVGDCIGACPYGNMYQQDVRWAIARLFARRSPSRTGTPLPMASAPARATAPSGEAAPVGSE